MVSAMFVKNYVIQDNRDVKNAVIQCGQNIMETKIRCPSCGAKLFQHEFDGYLKCKKCPYINDSLAKKIRE